MILTNAEQNTPKCWAICSSDDGDGKTMLLSTQLNENKWRRGILTFEVKRSTVYCVDLFF